MDDLARSVRNNGRVARSPTEKAIWEKLAIGDSPIRHKCSKQRKAPLARRLEGSAWGEGWGRTVPHLMPSIRETLFIFRSRHLTDYHSFQASPAQYPRPLCSRKVILGPGFQVSS